MRNQSYHVDANGCWRWRGTKTTHGYSQMVVRRGAGFASVRAHRHWFEFFCGSPRPGQVIRHICDVKDCVNPSHLVAGSQADNIRDKVSRGRQARGSTVASAKLTEGDAIRIIAMLKQGLTCARIAARFGVTRGAVSHIKHGRNWRHLHG